MSQTTGMATLGDIVHAKPAQREKTKNPNSGASLDFPDLLPTVAPAFASLEAEEAAVARAIEEMEKAKALEIKFKAWFQETFLPALKNYVGRILALEHEFFTLPDDAVPDEQAKIRARKRGELSQLVTYLTKALTFYKEPVFANAVKLGYARELVDQAAALPEIVFGIVDDVRQRLVDINILVPGESSDKMSVKLPRGFVTVARELRTTSDGPFIINRLRKIAHRLQGLQDKQRRTDLERLNAWVNENPITPSDFARGTDGRCRLIVPNHKIPSKGTNGEATEKFVLGGSLFIQAAGDTVVVVEGVQDEGRPPVFAKYVKENVANVTITRTSLATDKVTTPAKVDREAFGQAVRVHRILRVALEHLKTLATKSEEAAAAAEGSDQAAPAAEPVNETKRAKRAASTKKRETRRAAKPTKKADTETHTPELTAAEAARKELDKPAE